MKIRLNPMSSPAFCGDLTFAAASAGPVGSAAAEAPADESAPIGAHWRHRHYHRHYRQRGR